FFLFCFVFFFFYRIRRSNFFFFFFSSRRRHTRSDRDWSSDVCSSDLRKCRYHEDQLAFPGQYSQTGGRKRRRDRQCHRRQHHHHTGGRRHRCTHRHHGRHLSQREQKKQAGLLGTSFDRHPPGRAFHRHWHHRLFLAGQTAAGFLSAFRQRRPG